MARPGLLPTEEAARVLGVEPATLEKWARLGIIKPTVTTDDGQMFWKPDLIREQVRRIQEGQR